MWLPISLAYSNLSNANANAKIKIKIKLKLKNKNKNKNENETSLQLCSRSYRPSESFWLFQSAKKKKFIYFFKALIEGSLISKTIELTLYL
jgi:hypothetical protein